MKYILLFFWLAPGVLTAQTVRFREIKRTPAPRFVTDPDSTIIYPLVIADDTMVSRRINAAMKQAVLPEGKTVRKALYSWAKDGLTDLNYEILYNKDGILSLRFNVELMVAHPVQWYLYLNFDTRTGKSLTVRDIIDARAYEKLRSRVMADKIDSIGQWKIELESQFKAKEIDAQEYQWAKDEVDSNCINTIHLEEFAISPMGIEFIDDCDFRYVIRGLAPTYALRYTYAVLRPYLKTEFRRRLHLTPPPQR